MYFKGRSLCNLRFADAIELLAGREEQESPPIGGASRELALNTLIVKMHPTWQQLSNINNLLT